MKHGLLLILWGYFLKLLIANRLAVLVDVAFLNYPEQTGATMMVSIIFYGIQLYADFAGYSCIAIGIAETLGYALTQNFRQPYFSQDVGEFWRRWHISLSSWLRDYIYIPLGGNRKGKTRQCVNLLMTFLISGLWHGTGWQFLIWGGIHGVYQIVSKCLMSIKSKITDIVLVKRNCFGYRLFQGIVTFALVDYAWLFFRASSIHEALSISKRILLNFHLVETILDKLYLVGYSETRFYILLVELFVLLIVDIIHEKKRSVTKWLNEQNKAFRWMIYLSAGLIRIIGILHDYGLDSSAFIYTRF